MENITLTAIRRHIKRHAWNGQDFSAKDSNYDVFRGQCEYASTAVSEMLTNTGKNEAEHPNWDMRIRGWYRGEITTVDRSESHSNFHPTENKHAHSWVRLPDGRILDPTWWQFTNAPVRVYIFPADDPRFEPDDAA